MSPEPTHEPIEQNLSIPVAAVGANNDSDSEDDDAATAGYMPLSQVPMDSDPMFDDDDDDDDEWISAPVGQSRETDAAVDDEFQDLSSDAVQTCGSGCDVSNIDLDSDKINQVKSMMATFTLPKTAIPEWASSISEDQWKELIDRIKFMQNKET